MAKRRVESLVKPPDLAPDLKENAFFVGRTVHDRAAGLRQLYTLRQIHAARQLAEFRTVLGILIDAAATAGEPRERLLALACLWKIASLTDELRTSLSPSVKQILKFEIAPLVVLESPEDRVAVLHWLAATPSSWTASYLAHVCVHEERSEDARSLAATTLIEQSPTLDTALSLLTDAFDAWSPTTKTSADTAVRRLTATLGAFVGALKREKASLGACPSQRIAALVTSARRKGDALQKPELLHELAEKTFELTLQLVMTHFWIAMEPSTYMAARSIREWITAYGTTVWPRFTSSSPGARNISQALVDAITLRAKLGFADSGLFEQLVVACGGRDSARARVKQIAGEHADIPEHVRYWLLHGEQSRDEDTAKVSRNPATDASWDHERLARLLQEAQRLRASRDEIESILFSEVEMLLPRLAPRLRRHLNHIEVLLDSIFVMAMTRGLRLRGEPGSTDIYSPLLHRSIDGDSITTRRVRILSPPVEYARHDGLSRIVLQGLVEPIPDGEE